MVSIALGVSLTPMFLTTIVDPDPWAHMERPGAFDFHDVPYFFDF